MEFPVNVWATVKILTTSSYNLIRNLSNFVLKSCIQLQSMPKCSYFMESAGAMHVRMQENMQYVFHDVCHNIFLRLVDRAGDTGSLVPT
jgi:hypothetical protein